MHRETDGCDSLRTQSHREGVGHVCKAYRVLIFITATIMAIFWCDAAQSESKRVFQLKNGSAVIGLVLDELEAGYLVMQNDGTTIRVLFEDVVSVHALGEEETEALDSTSTSQEKESRQPIKHLGGMMYSIGDETQNVYRVKHVLGDEPQLLKKFSGGEAATKLGGVLFIPGGGLLAAGLVLAIAEEPENCQSLVGSMAGMSHCSWEQGPAATFFATSISCLVSAVVLSAAGDQEMKKALRQYNATVAFDGSSTSFRLALSF